jgi:predicted O-methyltransferase YrrM
MSAPSATVERGSPHRLVELGDYIVPITLRVIADLGVADHLTDGPRPVQELAEATGTDAPSLARALRALACKGVFTETTAGSFGLTPMAELLRSEHPVSFRGMLTMLPFDLAALTHLEYSLRTGRPAFEEVHGQSYWSHFAEHSEASERFDRFMQSLTRLVLRSVLGRYPWEQLESIVDVGGGNGTFLAGLLARNGSIRGVLVDLPHVAAGAAAVLDAAGVADRCEVIAGDFFTRLPAGADGYVLKLILHDWDDEQAIRILHAVRAAMRPDSRLLILDAVVPPGDSFDPAKALDVQMLALTGGRERTQEEIEELLAATGLGLREIIRTVTLPILDVRLGER